MKKQEKEIKKISPFEFAVMELADPEGAKNYQPYSKEEVLQQRRDNIEKQLRKIKIKNL